MLMPLPRAEGILGWRSVLLPDTTPVVTPGVRGLWYMIQEGCRQFPSSEVPSNRRRKAKQLSLHPLPVLQPKCGETSTIKVVRNFNPGTGEAEARDTLRLRPAWFTEGNPASKNQKGRKKKKSEENELRKSMHPSYSPSGHCISNVGGGVESNLVGSPKELLHPQCHQSTHPHRSTVPGSSS